MSIWKFSQQLKPFIKESFKLSLGEGNTPCQEIPSLTAKLNLKKLYFKREDLNPHGSHKDRGLAYQLAFYRQEGFVKYVLSSSGNAAISALDYCHKSNVTLKIFLANTLSKTKVNRLNNLLEQIKINIKLEFPLKISKTYISKDVSITIDDKPLSKSFKFVKDKQFISLRGSTDLQGTVGYQTIAFELINQAPLTSQIFIPCSSGTTAQGIMEGYQFMQKRLKNHLPQLHCVQTTKVNIISREFDKDFLSTRESKAQAIVDKIGHRQSKIVQLIKETKGFGWTVNDKTIIKAYHLLKKVGINCSYTGALGLAGIIKAQSRGYVINQPLVIITGTQ